MVGFQNKSLLGEKFNGSKCYGPTTLWSVDKPVGGQGGRGSVAQARMGLGKVVVGGTIHWHIAHVAACKCFCHNSRAFFNYNKGTYSQAVERKGAKKRIQCIMVMCIIVRMIYVCAYW